MNSMEFRLRSTSASPMKGLSFGYGAVSAWTYDEDPIEPLRFADSLAWLQEQVATGGDKVFVDLLDKYVLQNGHRATVSLVPEPTKAARVQQEEDVELEAVTAALSADGRAALVEATSALRAAQAAPDDPQALAKLPVLSTADLDRAVPPSAPTEVSELSLEGGGSATLLAHELPTDGIVYLDIALPMSRVALEDVAYLPLLSSMMSSFGTSTEDEATFSRRVDAQTGGLGMGPQTMAVPGRAWTVGDRDDLSSYWMVSGKATGARAGSLFSLAAQMLTEVQLDNPSRVVEMLTQRLSAMESSASTSGSYASSGLGGRLSLAGHVDEIMGGLSAMGTAREALAQAQADWPSLLARLERMRAALLVPDGAIINLSADAPSMAAALKHVPSFLAALPSDEAPSPPSPWLRPTASGILVPTHEGLQVPTQVNYVVKSAAIYDPGETISGATSVITKYLGTAYLWDKVRVQGGAYGCSLGFSQISGIATYSSYRDPNVASTLAAYDATGDYLREHPLSAADLSKAIIGAVGALDTPQSVNGKGSSAMLRHMLGVTDEDRQVWRDQVLGTTAADFVAFADRLDRVVDGGSVAVIASERAIAEANGVLPEGRRLEARRIL